MGGIRMTDRAPFNQKRSAAMARTWARRKAQAAAEAAWFEKPICLCGCGESLARHHNPERQRFFRQGHDARLKSAAAGILSGELPESVIPEVTRMLKHRIGFLRTRPGLAKAF
jgi:hypothetical protein